MTIEELEQTRDLIREQLALCVRKFEETEGAEEERWHEHKNKLRRWVEEIQSDYREAKMRGCL